MVETGHPDGALLRVHGVAVEGEEAVEVHPGVGHVLDVLLHVDLDPADLPDRAHDLVVLKPGDLKVGDPEVLEYTRFLKALLQKTKKLYK